MMYYFYLQRFWWASLPMEIEAGLPAICITNANKTITIARKCSAHK